MNALIVSVFSWIDDFLKDGTTGGRSSSRLIACGAATVMALYLVADMASRFLKMGGMNENIALACVGGLVTLGGGVYIANKVAGVKRGQTDADT